ncbi:unnamed protein product [Ectocarpus sp. CCAP 1310/34]|nr:unnamed protein product [Ectocarpus sp. CCAP 1310/34]
MGCISSKNTNEDSGDSGGAGAPGSLRGQQTAQQAAGGGAPVSIREISLTKSNVGAVGSSEPRPGFEQMYQLGKELGHGSFSTVREGTHKESGERFAVKCVKRADLPPEDEADLKMEVKLLQEIEHENIVKLYDFYQEKHFFYLVMEILDGGELFDRIVLKQVYNEKEARDVLKVLFKAIKYCHDRDIAHRDLKPENLLLVSDDDDAVIKLADFGFARPVGETGLSAQCGTPGYVAPEVLKGEVYGKPVDIWSIGVITYILLGGYPPFHDDNQAKLYQKIKKGKVLFHPQYWSTVSDEAKDLIKKMLTLDKDKRITAEQALEHPWVVGDAAELEKHDLGANMGKLRLFNARRKFKSAISSVIAAQALLNVAESVGMDRSEKPGTSAPDGSATEVPPAPAGIPSSDAPPPADDDVPPPSIQE